MCRRTLTDAAARRTLAGADSHTLVGTKVGSDGHGNLLSEAIWEGTSGYRDAEEIGSPFSERVVDGEPHAAPAVGAMKRGAPAVDPAPRDALDTQRRDEILDTASSVFASSGLRTTLQEIAEASGIQPGSLYHHFESKEGIVVELVKRYHADLDRQAEIALKELRESASGDTPHRIIAFSTAIAQYAARHRRGRTVLLLRPSGEFRSRTGPTRGAGAHGNREGDAQDPRGRACRRLPSR